jgi:nitroreductase
MVAPTKPSPISIFTWLLVTLTNKPGANMNEFIDIIYARRSIRKYKDTPVPREILETLLKAAMAAPTATNAQPWEFVVVTNPETLAKLRSGLPFAKMNAPAVICVLGSERMQRSKIGSRFWVQDCSAATENILLAATALGLGSVWVGVHPITIFTNHVKRTLNLPDGVTPLNLIFLGYPDEKKEPRTQYEEKRVQWEAFPLSKFSRGKSKKEEIELIEE